MKQIRLIILITLMLGMTLIIADYAYASEGLKTISSQEVGRIIMEYMVHNTPWTEDQINIKNISVSNKLILADNWSYNITPAPRSSMIGRSAFLLDITNEDNSIQSSWVSADIEVWVDVLLSSKPLKEKQMVEEDKIYMGKKELSKLPAGYIDDIKQVSGKRVKRFIGANSILTENILEEPPVFKRGDKVFIIAESEVLKVTAVGLAGEDGYRGRTVRITNMYSKKEVIGNVIDNGTVSVKW